MTTSNQLKQVVSLIEKLAELEHKQWVYWSKDIASKEKLSKKRLERWISLWKPYSQLTEKEKKQDRIWARKVLKILKGGKRNSSHD